jgi:hypothetical protein
MLIGRRGLLTVPAALLATGAPAANGRDRGLGFDVMWRGSKVGRHEVRILETAEGLTVATTVDITIRLAFVTIARFSQTADDLWQDGVLVRSRAQTNEDGEVTTLAATRDGDALLVEGASGTHRYPLGTMTDLCIWNPAIAAESRIVDTRTGRLDGFEILEKAAETLALDGRQVSAQRVGFRVDDGRRGRLWFDTGGLWLKAELETRGQTFRYLPAP